ncbi:6-hydroxymethylpterin diphosphokinase MptE-like protein [Heyndrickxia sp. NPDC080065]|uniref:6-hydroxymethylpterin diphosphokinase MptE-like protein n=1 Tax=Heyndrickxia sp. NPDC080065 TaxID=3390568 RepID=UPI003CFEE050
MTIKTMLKSNKFTYYLITKIRNIQYNIIPTITSIILFNVKKFLRVARLNKKSRYEKLRQLKNKHKGERCFIVATGPSLTIEDLEKLKNEVTFSMNSICLAFEETNWRPTYYGIQDVGVFNKFEKSIETLEVDCKFIGETIANQKHIPDDYYIYPMNMLNHNIVHHKYHTKFSNDAFAVVYDGYTVTYSLIQLAVFMGFKEIYLLGTDCNYSSNMNHHFVNYDHVDPSYLSAGDKMICAYEEAKKYADRHQIKIYNATRGGMLEVFERVHLEAVLSNSSQNTELLEAGIG